MKVLIAVSLNGMLVPISMASAVVKDLGRAS